MWLARFPPETVHAVQTSAATEVTSEPNGRELNLYLPGKQICIAF